MMHGGPDQRFYEPPRGGGAGGSRRGGRVSLFVGLVVIAFVITLAAMIGQRLSDQAVAVLAGAVCGVGASIPTSLLIVWVTRRRQEARSLPPQQNTYPPVVVIQSPPHTGQAALPQGGYMPPYMQPMPPTPREFTVVGEEDEPEFRGRRW